MNKRVGKNGQKSYRSMFRKQKSLFMQKCSGRLNGKMPKSEQWFRELLEDYGLYKRFKKNRPIYHLEVIPDLLDQEYMIVIEVDGTIHQKESVIERDREKDEKYQKAGYKVFRVVHGDEAGASKVMDELVEIYRKPSKKQVRRVQRKQQRAWKEDKAFEAIPLEQQVASIQAILGTKKLKPGPIRS